MNWLKVSGLTLLYVLAVIPAVTRAVVPLQINHQGVVAVNGVRFDGNGDFRFALVDGNTNDYLWTNDGSLVAHPNPPTAPVNLPVDNGVYSTRLGDTDLINMTQIPAGVFSHPNVVLRVWFDDTQGNGIQQMAPDQSLTSSPFTFHADRADIAADAESLGGVSATEVLSQAGSFVGMIVPFYHPSLAQPSPPNIYDFIPPNWVLCDGKTLDDTHPSGLAASEVDPAFWGKQLPDLRDRFPRGVPAGSEDQLGNTGGSFNGMTGNSTANG